jgi:hypothetical protein
MKVQIPEDLVPYDLLSPAADAAGRTSAYLSLKGAVRAWIVVYINQGAANTVLLSPLQATAVAGTGTKAISAARIWTKLDQAFTVFVKQTEAATFTTDAAVKSKVVVFELDPAKVFDVANSFDCIAISTGASAAGNITSAVLWIQPMHRGATTYNPLLD